MNLAATLFCAVSTLLTVQAITVSVDRADVRPVSVQPSAEQESLFVNGWRPLTSGYDGIGVNVSPAAPLHPVLGKLQEHMQKPQRRKQPQQQLEFAPPSILGSFGLFSAPAGSSKQGSEPKSLSTEREYSFLVPPPRDSLRFELESHKKASLRDGEPYVRSSQFVPQAIKPDPRSPTYYIKPASYSTAVHPFAQQARPFGTGYEQPQLLPHRQPAKQFEPLKAGKPEPQPQQHQFDRYQQQQQQQLANGHYYNQISHPAHYKQPSFEREPSFLVHESHDVSYVTPAAYKYRPATYHFDGPATPEAYPSSTVSPRPDAFKQFKEPEKPQRANGNNNPNPNPNAYYINDFQKTRLHAPDINEVLPKPNQPAKFSQPQQQLSTTPAYAPEHGPKLVYVRPDLQQQQQYPSSIIPLNINQRPSELEYATPEEISLKHFNQQQFALQQQLIQQDRQRLREVEKHRQQELQRQQQEELHKRQQEIKLLEQKQREKQRLEQQQKFEQHQQQQQQQHQQHKLDQQQKFEQPLDIVKELVHSRPVHHFGQQYSPAPEEQPRKQQQQQQPQEQYKVVHYQQQPSSPEPPSSEPAKQLSGQKFEEVVTPAFEQHTTQEEFQPVLRPYRPQKPLFREPARRRKPTTPAYETAPTEAPTESPTPAQETYPYEELLTDAPLQTTPALETTTTPPATERPTLRTRRPGAPLRRRRPSTTTTTTTTPEPSVSSAQEYEEEVAKYHTPEIRDFEKKKRVRPVANSHPDASAERRPLRKRPGQRVKYHSKEHSDSDSVPERTRTTVQPFREITENYPAPFLKELYSSEKLETGPQEPTTESIPLEFYSAETTVPSNLEYYEPTHDDRQEQYAQTAEEVVPPEYVFTKTEVSYVETTTAPPTTTSPSTTSTTSTEAPTSPKAIISSPKATHRMRPVRYGNATRPRFSIKDYKTRMEYKNRLAQSSSTEASTAVTAAAPKTRGYKNQQAPADPNFKEAPARYKYTSRSSYRTTSTTQPTQPEEATTDRGRFTPKKRVNGNHYYRSRVTTARPEQQQDHSAAHSTARPENVFSSAIRKRPTLKSRLQQSKIAAAAAAATEAPEMQSAAETGFFATTTLASSSSEAVNEIDEAATPGPVVQDEKPAPAAELGADLSDVTMDESDGPAPDQEAVEEHKVVEVQNAEGNEEATTARSGANEETAESDNYPPARQQQPSPAESTTPFDLRHEEELFAKASQSVADLTSSASALYDKPGMFKAVSPAGENRLISAHLKIATDEPTLPIEAFFHEISKKN